MSELVGDGVTDDAAALQALVDAGEKIPAGKYKINAALFIREGGNTFEGVSLVMTDEEG